MKIDALEALHKQEMYDLPKTEKEKRFPKVWKVAKPFLLVLSESFFIPTKWRQVLKVLVVEVDILAGNEPEALEL